MAATIEVNGVSKRFGPALGALVPAAGPLADLLAIEAARNLLANRLPPGRNREAMDDDDLIAVVTGG